MRTFRGFASRRGAWTSVPDNVTDPTSLPVRARDEAGASLVLALLFMVVIGVLVGAIATWTSNDLSNTVVFQKNNAVQSALSSATNVAIQNIRYTPLITSPPSTLNASPPSVCWVPPTSGGPSALTTQNIAVDVWCSTAWDPTNSVSPTVTRTVTISACVTTVTSDPATCASTP
jgi:hypothetical protein